MLLYILIYLLRMYMVLYITHKLYDFFIIIQIYLNYKCIIYYSIYLIKVTNHYFRLLLKLFTLHRLTTFT